jgi:Skp family chaperone for outer membrane proteins
LEEIKRLEDKHEAIERLMQAVNAKYEAKKAQLQDNETFTQLNALEQRLKQHEGINFVLRDCMFGSLVSCCDSNKGASRYSCQDV